MNNEIMHLLTETEWYRFLDYIGVGLFAATGALVAARGRHDIVTFIFFAAVTGIGGGTLRDVILATPVFWIRDSGYLIMCTGVALLIWLLGARLHISSKAILWLDAVGLAAYAVLGASKAIGLGFSDITAILMGVLSATFGGIIRDVLGAEQSVLLRREVYVTAALAGATFYTILVQWSPMSSGAAAVVAFAVGLSIRSISLKYGCSLPAFRGLRKGAGDS